MQRTARERIIQTLIFEAGGIILATPLYEAVFGGSAHCAFLLMAALSAAVLIITPLHNMLFDHIEHSLTGRPASDRPHGIRVLHAITHEVAPIAITLPMIMVLGHHSLAEALSVNAGLTLLYVGYAYGFYLVYDRVRPVRAVAA